MRVLFLPSFYPSVQLPIFGVFFRELTLAARFAGVDAGVAYAEVRSLRRPQLSSLKKSYFQVSSGVEEGIPTVRRHGWNTFAQVRVGAEIWIRQMQSLATIFATRFGSPDLVHAHNVAWAGVAAARVARTLGCRYLITEHSSAVLAGDWLRGRRAEVALTYRGAAAVVCVSRCLAAAVKDVVGGPDPLVIPNTVDTQFFTLPPEPRSDSQFVFSSIGNLTENKGFDLVIHAFAARFAGCTDVRLEIGGDGPEWLGLVALAQQLGVADRVRFLGPLSRGQVREAMWRANAFVLASACETFGVVLIEALSTGLPVIATRSGGPEEIVTPQVGMLVRSRDAIELASAMGNLRDSTQYQAPILRSYVVDRFGHATIGAALRRVYEACIG